MGTKTKFMENVCLGGASFAGLNERELTKFFGTAYDLGVRRIDTAPSYAASEFLIGACATRFQKWEISTKVGNPGGEVPSSKMIINSVDSSLKSLKIENISVLFLHSTKFEDLSDEVIQVLEKMKEVGKIKQFGFSGDGNDLQKYSNLDAIDVVMSTVNFLDVGNLGVLPEDKLVFVKRPLANSAWKKHPVAKAKYFLRNLKIPKPQEGSYEERLKILSKEMPEIQGISYLHFAIQFLKSLENYRSLIICLGTTNVQHLEEVGKLLEKNANKYNYDMEYHKEVMQYLSKSNRWSIVN